jgi:hypothetical protein
MESSSSSNSRMLKLSQGQAIKFGAQDQDEISLTDEEFDADGDDGLNFKFRGNVTDISGTTITLSNGKSFTLGDDQMTFLTKNGVVTQGTQIQMIGNNSQNGNVVRILKIRNADGTMTMVRLHTNDQVSQTSVKTTGGKAPLSGFLAQIVSFFQSLLGGGSGSATPSPLPSMSPSASPSESPTASPTSSPSPTSTP